MLKYFDFSWYGWNKKLDFHPGNRERNWSIYRRILEGVSTKFLCDAHGLSATSIRLIETKAYHIFYNRARRRRAIRDGSIPLKKVRSRPIDMGGPRGVWMVFYPGPPR